MEAMQSPLVLEVLDSKETISLDSFAAIVAGYTGRDKAKVQEHIDELAEIGVAPPPQVPMFYPVDPQTVTTDSVIQVASSATSGEVEPVYIRHQGKYYLGVASDHTDRHLEAEDVGDSKRVCPKPIAAVVMRVDDFEHLLLDDATVECRVDGQLYQQGTLDGLRVPQDVVQRLLKSIGEIDGDFVCLGGTVPLQTESFIYGTTWELEMALGSSVIKHTYTVHAN